MKIKKHISQFNDEENYTIFCSQEDKTDGSFIDGLMKSFFEQYPNNKCLILWRNKDCEETIINMGFIGLNGLGIKEGKK